MKNRIFKELSRPIISLLLVCICAIGLAEEQPVKSMLKELESRLDTYKNAFRSGDYTTAASCVAPNMINKIGGKENFEKLVTKFANNTIITLRPSLIEFSKPEEIIRYNNMYISVIKQSIPITTKGIDKELKEAYLTFHPNFPATIFEGMDGLFNLPIVAFSEDEGDTWHFTGGNRTSLNVENIKPDILEKVNIPVPSIIFGEGNEEIILYRQQRQWVRKKPGLSDGMAEKSIILTIGEQTGGSQSDLTNQEIPDDSLDPYIYLEEHPDVLGITSVEQDNQVTKKKLIKKNKIVHESSKHISSSVFVTNDSRTFHRSDCPELDTGERMEFNSVNEALDAGGVPCEKCN